MKFIRFTFERYEHPLTNSIPEQSDYTSTISLRPFIYDIGFP